MKNFFKILIIILLLDFSISTIFLKKTNLWEYKNWDHKYWRIESDIYHHDLMASINVVENWGGNLEKRIITNSLGFRDYKNKIVKKQSLKERILLIGDSFIEGTGYDYEHTIGGLLQNELGDKYEVLNSAVGSYSPSIYYKKINHFISKGYNFDHAIVFLDVSDIFDELYIKFDDKENIITKTKVDNKSVFKKKFYSFGEFLRDNTITMRFFYILSDKTEIYKNYLKLKYKSSKFMNKSFFKTNRDDVMFYRMTHIDRGYWTFDEKKYAHVKDGLKQSEKYLKKLFDLLNNNSIKSHLVIYPWPTQIYFGDSKHEKFWEKFSKQNDIHLINLYEKFTTNNSRKFIFDNFIYGDIHWNKNGTKIVFDEIINLF
jgi:hypothetical protein